MAALAKGEGLAAVFDRLRTPPEMTVAFTIAVIALSAKLAKADGQVTRDEVAAFRQVFAIPPGEEANAARVFNLARQDVAGYEAYASKIAAMFAADREMRIDILEALFHVAMADGEFHPGEDAYLRTVAALFGLGEPCYRAMRERFVPGSPHDPYDVLGVAPDAPLEAVRAAWRQAVLESHPDRMMARGVPPEAVRLAERRLVAVNAAWDEISRDRAA
ncbi:MAG: TerB family tellurite resistance protein [Gemmobacter sp.]